MDINVKELESVETDIYQLCVFECLECGFHIGLDFSYLDQCGGITMDCPSCGHSIEVGDRFNG